MQKMFVCIKVFVSKLACEVAKITRTLGSSAAIRFVSPPGKMTGKDCHGIAVALFQVRTSPP